jgi:hypothetical protein
VNGEANRFWERFLGEDYAWYIIRSGSWRVTLVFKGTAIAAELNAVWHFRDAVAKLEECE